MPFERHRSEVRRIPPVFVGVHLNVEVLEKEWVHGTLKLERSSLRSKNVRKHLDLCEHCREEVEKLEQEKVKLLEDGRSRAAGY
ncbi:MAG TPA: hypothetical protein VFK07_01530 [Candidatus Paceibacterota bacterium]|nr:hypothetical protein [Candidatus Paceibacterota bacterium]